MEVLLGEEEQVGVVLLLAQLAREDHVPSLSVSLLKLIRPHSREQVSELLRHQEDSDLSISQVLPHVLADHFGGLERVSQIPQSHEAVKLMSKKL